MANKGNQIRKTLFFGIFLLNFGKMLSQDNFKHKYEFKTKFNTAYVLQEVVPGVLAVPAVPAFAAGPAVAAVPAIPQTYNTRRIKTKLVGQFAINDSKDTIFIKPWPAKVGTNNLTNTPAPPIAPTLLSNTTNTYILTSINWQPDVFKHNAINIPYSTILVTAINIPIRIDFKDQAAIADFLNIGLGCYYIKGRRKIFQSDFVSPRNKFIGVGGYLGARAIDEKKTVGVNYGASMILSLNSVHAIFTLGNESGFDVDNNLWNPYFGLGLGIKLIDLAEE